MSSLRTPAALSFSPASPVPAALPDPWTAAPDENVRLARRLFEEAGLVPAGFAGRVGLMLTLKDGLLCAQALLEPVRPELMTPWREARASLLHPSVEDEDVRDAVLIDGLGRTTAFRALLDDVFAPFPDRDDDHGGREQRARRALWRGFLTDGLDDPCVRLLMRRNADPAARASDRVVALASWWSGPSPSWDIRHDGAFCAPKSGARFLLSKLLEGIPHEPPRPQQDPDARPELPVLYEDEHLIVVDKPARLASVPGGSESTSVKAILEETRGELFVVHRLDMGTSGVLAFAKSREALRPLNLAFADRTAEKTYIARLEGVLAGENRQQGSIALPIALHWFDRPRQCVLPVSQGGRAAHTDYEVIGIEDTPEGLKSLVALRPRTGRTHQLRVHCAHPEGLGLPIDGDVFYGSRGMLEETREHRLCLHAATLRIRHPMTGTMLDITAPFDFPNF